MPCFCAFICYRRRAQEADRREPLSRIGPVGPLLVIDNQPALPPAAAPPPVTACLPASTRSDGDGVRCVATVAAQVVCVVLPCSSLAVIGPRVPSVASAAAFHCGLRLSYCVVSMRGGGCLLVNLVRVCAYPCLGFCVTAVCLLFGLMRSPHLFLHSISSWRAPQCRIPAAACGFKMLCPLLLRARATQPAVRTSPASAFSPCSVKTWTGALYTLAPIDESSPRARGLAKGRQ